MLGYHNTYFEMPRRPLNPHGVRSRTAFFTIDIKCKTSPLGHEEKHEAHL